VTVAEAVPQRGVPLVLRGRVLAADRPAVMAVVNRTPDSFHTHNDDDAGAREVVARAVAEGADLVDIGGVRAGRGPDVDAAAEIDRVRPLVRWVRATWPDLPISVDTWRAEVAEAVLDAGADLVNDTWAGHDPGLVDVAAAHGAGIVCSHTGGLAPRTDPMRQQYLAPAGVADPRDGVLDDVLATVGAAARRAVDAGIDPRSVLVDPTHDFGKTTWHSLHLTRHTPELVALGFPVLMAMSRKDFVGESLGLPAEERLEGTLAAVAVAAWLGATVFRVHDVQAARRVVQMVAVLRGDAPPVRAMRGLG
jgi:dihydropteroate synthase